MKPWWRKRETPQPVEKRMVPDIRTEVHETTTILVKLHGMQFQHSEPMTFAGKMELVELFSFHARYQAVQIKTGQNLFSAFLQDWRTNGYRMDGDKVIPWSAFTGAEIIREDKITQEFQVQYGMKEEA